MKEVKTTYAIDSLIEKIIREASLEIRLRNHFYHDYIGYINPKEGDNNNQDNEEAREYAERNVRDVKNIVNEWLKDGQPE